MENGPFRDDIPIRNGGCSIATVDVSEIRLATWDV